MTWFRCSSGASLGTKSITANGTYNAPSDNLDGYSSVTANVQPNVGTKNITANGTYSASSDNLDGYSSVTVNVPNVAQGTFTPDSAQYLYHDIEGVDDSVYEIAHGLGYTPTFFFMWVDQNSGVGGVGVLTNALLLPSQMAMYQSDSDCAMGHARSSSESSVTFYSYGGDCVVADSTKITLKGSNTSQSYYLRANSVYKWVAF